MVFIQWTLTNPNSPVPGVFGLVNLFGLEKWACLFTTDHATTSTQFSVHSVVRGHHAYKKIWTPYLGEILDLHPEV